MKIYILWMLIILEITYNGSAQRLLGYRRIIDGKLTSVHDHPYMVAMLTDSQLVTDSHDLHFRCSGTLITEKAIVSVAHCFFTSYGEAIPANEWKARIGSSFCYLGGALYDIEIIYHKNYDNETRKNDVAIVETMERVQYIDSLVKPIAIADANHVIIDQDSLTVLGWGKTAETARCMALSGTDWKSKGGRTSMVFNSGRLPASVSNNTVITFHSEAPNNLHEVQMEVLVNELCNEVYEHLLGTPEAHDYFDLEPGEEVFRPVSDGMMCAHGKDGKGVCMGDSGGAVVHNGVLVAMVALVPASCNSSLPAVFTRVSYYEPWIQAIIGTMTVQSTSPLPAPS